MATYSQSIKGVVSGISQQPPILRLPEQLEEQLNGFSTEASGLQKRPPSLHVKVLSQLALDNTSAPLVHYVKRNATTQYTIVFKNGAIQVFDLEGNFKTVNIIDDPWYLGTTDPRADLRVVTVADYTFITNKNIKTKMNDETFPDYFSSQGALINVKSGQYGRTYRIWANGNWIASYTTPDGSNASDTNKIDVGYITEQLATACRTSGWTCSTGDTWLHLQGTNVTVGTQDGFNNLAMIGITSSVQRFSLLPATAPDNYCVKVKGDPNGNDAGSYYVKYNNTDKVWEECCKPTIQICIDPAYMPHTLIRNSDGSFDFKRHDWNKRKIGDDDSNPLPSFIGSTINEVFFYRNRLGFASGENLIMSESAEYFNMWMTTANDILDTDCIDIPASSARINILKYVVAFNGNLYAFSDDSQFLLRIDTVLSPKNCSLPEVTSFNSSPDCRPAVSGKNLYFAAERSEYSSIKEYYTVQDVSDIRNAQDITSHVPSYIPNGIYKIIPNTSENLLFFLTTGDSKSIYMYKYCFIDEKRVQASWSKWEFNGEIYGGFFIGSTFYMLIKRGETLLLESIKFTYNTTDYDEEPYRVYLDMKKIATTAVYDAVYERTAYNVLNEYTLSNFNFIDTLGVVTADGTYLVIDKDDILPDGTFYIKGNHAGTHVVIGVPYTFKATLSTFYFKKQDATGGTQALTNGRLQVRKLHVNYNNTGGFIVKVINKSNKKTYTYQMTTRSIGTPSATLGLIQNDTGVFKCPIQTVNTGCKISIESDFPVSLSIVGLIYEGNFIPKTKGV